MAPTFLGEKQRTLFRFFQRNKTVREIISSASEIQENLDWAMTEQVPLKIFVEGRPQNIPALLVEIDHSSNGAYVQFLLEKTIEALPILKGNNNLVIEYESNRVNRFRFQTSPLSKIDRESGVFRAGYPSLIESFQDMDAARFKNAIKDPIPVDVEEQRGVVIDIGIHGLKFTCNQIYEKGELLKDLQINLPRYGLVQGSAVVKYMQPTKEYPLWRYLCGVEFTEMKSKDQKRLTRYVNRMLRL